MAVRIGELLLKEECITALQLQEALDRQEEHGGKLGFNLAQLGFVEDDEIASRDRIAQAQASGGGSPVRSINNPTFLGFRINLW